MLWPTRFSCNCHSCFLDSSATIFYDKNSKLTTSQLKLHHGCIAGVCAVADELFALKFGELPLPHKTGDGSSTATQYTVEAELDHPGSITNQPFVLIDQLGDGFLMQVMFQIVHRNNLLRSLYKNDSALAGFVANPWLDPVFIHSYLDSLACNNNALISQRSAEELSSSITLMECNIGRSHRMLRFWCNLRKVENFAFGNGSKNVVGGSFFRNIRHKYTSIILGRATSIAECIFAILPVVVAVDFQANFLSVDHCFVGDGTTSIHDRPRRRNCGLDYGGAMECS